MSRRFSHLFITFLALLIAGPTYAQSPWGQLSPGDTDETAAGSVVGPSASADVVLADGAWKKLDVVNDTDCDIQIKLEDITGTPIIAIPAGTSFEEEYGAIGGYLGSSAALAYMSGETCSSGSVYVRGVK